MRSRIRMYCLGWAGLVMACGGVTQPLGDVEGASGSSSGGSSAGSTQSGAGGGNSAPSHLCETECVRNLFSMPTSCKLCHSGRPAPEGLQLSGLDLESPGLTARLKDVPSKHTDLSPGMSAADCPTGDKLLDTASPENSWLLKKVRGQQGHCGDVMPQTGELRADELACLDTYVYCVAGQTP